MLKIETEFRLCELGSFLVIVFGTVLNKPVISDSSLFERDMMNCRLCLPIDYCYPLLHYPIRK